MCDRSAVGKRIVYVELDSQAGRSAECRLLPPLAAHHRQTATRHCPGADWLQVAVAADLAHPHNRLIVDDYELCADGASYRLRTMGTGGCSDAAAAAPAAMHD